LNAGQLIERTPHPLLSDVLHRVRLRVLANARLGGSVTDTGLRRAVLGHLTLTGKELKTLLGTQARVWWIEPVAQAKRLAAALGWLDDLDRGQRSTRHRPDPVIDAE
jgi:hypothetical protein